VQAVALATDDCVQFTSDAIGLELLCWRLMDILNNELSSDEF